MACIDLNKELAANDLSLTFEDVQQIICILYCVGTVDISPQKVASLRLIAQVQDFIVMQPQILGSAIRNETNM